MNLQKEKSKRENGSGLLSFLQRMGEKNWANFSANVINLCTKKNSVALKSF